MNTLNSILLGLSLAVVGSSLAAAQESSSETASMPKVLQITREFIKPGKSGAVHDKSESAFVQAMVRSKFRTHYIALNSLTGKSRALYLTHYDSFESWEMDNKTVDKDKALSADLERASVADGELLASMDSMVYTYEADLSYRPRADLSHARYMEISVFHVRLGHNGEWRKLVKMYRDGQEKGGTSAHWALFELAYGGDDGTWVLLSSDKSMADIDTGLKEDKQFRDAMGEEGMKKLDELYGATVENAHTELFSINPKQSYAPEEWVKADPEFWKPKPAAAAKPVAATEKKTTP